MIETHIQTTTKLTISDNTETMKKERDSVVHCTSFHIQTKVTHRMSRKNAQQLSLWATHQCIIHPFLQWNENGLDVCVNVPFNNKCAMLSTGFCILWSAVYANEISCLLAVATVGSWNELSRLFCSAHVFHWMRKF